MSHVPVLCYCNSTTHEYHTIVFLSLSVILLYTLLVVTLGYVIREPRNFVVSDRQLSILLTAVLFRSVFRLTLATISHSPGLAMNQPAL